MGLDEESDCQMPFLDPNYVSSSSSSQSSKLALKRTGNEWTALAHLITAVIGSGVLSLAWSMAQLGWVAGPLTMLVFACVSLTSVFLLCNCYKSPDPETGPDRNGCYLDAVQKILGKRNAWFCGIAVRINFIKLAIIYTITSASSIQPIIFSKVQWRSQEFGKEYADFLLSCVKAKGVHGTILRLRWLSQCSKLMRAIQKSNCYHDQGHKVTCGYESTRYMVIFGLIQVIVSQIPDFPNMKWLSVVAAVMSFTYSIIGSALGLAKVIENGEIKGSITGLPSSTAAEKVWLVAQALGNIAFAFPFSLIFLEVQDTLKAPPPEKITMKKVSIMTSCITTFFYLCCGGFGYAAFGNSTPGNLLTGFGFYEPYWLVDFANACVILHLVGGYQVFSQPIFAEVERWFARKFPDSKFVHKNHTLKPLSMLPFSLNFMRLFFRTAYVAIMTGIAVLFPYFNQVVGVSGAITFWPIVVYFPVEMYLTQKRIESWKSKAIMFRVFTMVCLVVILYAFVGSIRGVIVARFR